jgi:hypothetical protein
VGSGGGEYEIDLGDDDDDEEDASGTHHQMNFSGSSPIQKDGSPEVRYSSP